MFLNKDHGKIDGNKKSDEEEKEIQPEFRVLHEDEEGPVEFREAEQTGDERVAENEEDVEADAEGKRREDEPLPIADVERELQENNADDARHHDRTNHFSTDSALTNIEALKHGPHGEEDDERMKYTFAEPTKKESVVEVEALSKVGVKIGAFHETFGRAILFEHANDERRKRCEGEVVEGEKPTIIQGLA